MSNTTAQKSCTLYNSIELSHQSSFHLALYSKHHCIRSAIYFNIKSSWLSLTVRYTSSFRGLLSSSCVISLYSHSQHKVELLITKIRSLVVCSNSENTSLPPFLVFTLGASLDYSQAFYGMSLVMTHILLLDGTNLSKVVMAWMSIIFISIPHTSPLLGDIWQQLKTKILFGLQI